ncbi:MAG: DNA primase [Thermoproteota archaeon]|nr:MAG: DNA primase [Candidatus Korarchaeota archaeon]RLG54553.1 MAG: DNA primase [Candidatus Korarchaeota archaeon]
MNQYEPTPSHKYLATFSIEVRGVVEPSDVIGAIFGQVEGLLGPELELRELQQSGKVGRIVVKLRRRDNHSVGIIELRSNLDRIRTALLVAAIETVDKVGPYQASLSLQRIVDERESDRERIRRRAIDILRHWGAKAEESYRNLIDQVVKETATMRLTYYGPEKLPCGVGVRDSGEIIVVEGRADVNNLLRYGFDNVIAIGGAVEKIPKSLVELISKKESIAFVDGDRGGEMILRSLLEQTDIDYVARAPKGKGVENLTAKEIRKALSSAIPAEEARNLLGLKQAKEEVKKVEPRPPRTSERIPQPLMQFFKEVENKREAILLDENLKVIAKVPINSLYETLDDYEGVRYVVYSGIITQRIIEKAFAAGVKMIVGGSTHNITKIPAGIRVVAAG